MVESGEKFRYLIAKIKFLVRKVCADCQVFFEGKCHYRL